MNYQTFVKNNKLVIIIALLVSFILVIHQIKPAFLYERNGSIRNFGFGVKSKTIIPLWLIVIVMSILFYIIVDYYVKFM
mgnify:CR=1 FL=1